MLGVLGLTAFAYGFLVSLEQGVPELDPAKQHTQANTYVYDRTGNTVLAILRGSQARIVVPSEQISPWMKHAIVAIEDKRFYEHRGVDIWGMARAFWNDLSHHGTVQGGSTITQQLIKNAYLNAQKSIGRKFKEAVLARQLEQRWSKDHILTAYLNTIYLDNHAYGVEQASKVYFDHPAATLDPAEAALLAGIVADPAAYDPVAHPVAARGRRNLVVRQMYLQGYLTTPQYRAAIRHSMPNPHDVRLSASLGQAAPFFASYVTTQLERHYGFGGVFGGGLKVKTTIDIGLQRLAAQAVNSVLSSPTGPAAALVAIDPRDGSVLAMVGGRNFHKSQFNLATQGQRQPGSSFKPFVLATALREGVAPSTVLVSKPTTIAVDSKLWVVNNYEGEYLGPIDLAKAIAVSDNSVYSQLAAIVGPTNVAATAKALGITTPLHGYFSIALGSEWSTPLDMARAYSSFADDGQRIDGSLFGNTPRAILSVQQGSKEEQNLPVKRPALGTVDESATRAAVVNQLLQGVLQSGTGQAAQIPGRQIAGKTGTTENYGDAWFVGYTPQLAIAVWVGYPDRQIPMTSEFHGKPVVGGTYPALIWKAFATKALPYLHDDPQTFAPAPYLYSSPQAVVDRGGKLQLDNGLCHNPFTVQLISGSSLPTANCKKNEVQVPNVVGSTLAKAQAVLAGQPLTPALVYEPAKPGQHTGIVVRQFPPNGTLSAYDKVTLVLRKEARPLALTRRSGG